MSTSLNEVKVKRLWPWGIVLGLIAVLGGREWTASRAWDRTEAEARRAGLPTRVIDMIGPPIPKGDNAAEDYWKAIPAHKLVPIQDRLLGELYCATIRKPDATKRFRDGGVSGAVDRARIEAALKAWMPVFDWVDRGTSKPALDWHRDWNQGIDLLLPEYASMKNIARGLAADAEIAASHREFDHALHRLRQIRAIAMQMEKESLAIALLVGAALRSIADKEAMVLAFDHSDDVGFVDDIRSFFVSETIPDIHPALKGETFAGLKFLEQGAEQPARVLSALSVHEDWRTPSSFALRALKVGSIRNGAQIKLTERYLSAWQKLPSDPAQWQSVENICNELDKAMVADSSWTGNFAGLVAPTYAYVGQVPGDTVARKRLGVTLCDLLDARRTIKRWPPRLPGGPHSVDPYSGKPLTYRVEAEGFTLYSVRADRKDDGGDFLRAKDIVISADGKVLETH